MKDFVLRLKHRTVLGEKTEFNVARAEHPVLQTLKKHTLLCILSGPHISEPYTCTLYTLADKKTHTHANRHIYLLFTHTSVIQKTDCKDVNSKESSLARGCSESEAAASHPHTPFLGGYDNHGRIRAISLQNTRTHTHTNNYTHLLYNGGELQAELNDIISGY